MSSLARAIACLLILTAPVSADVTSWQGWAFELRGDGLVGWVGAWTPGACEVQRREALEAKLNASIGVCHPVTLTDEPAGFQVWAVMRAEDGFVAASSPAICEPENAPGPGMRPVSLADGCQPMWLQVPS
jgi:hypothetical protein